MRKILVIGGAGFIGRSLCDNLLAANEDFIVIDKFDSQIHGDDIHKASADFANYVGEQRLLVEDYASEKSFHLLADYRPDTIVFLSSQTGTSDGNNRLQYYQDENCGKYIRFLEKIEQMKLGAEFILTSSRAVYGDGCYTAPNGELHLSHSRHAQELERGNYNYDWEMQGHIFAPHDVMQPVCPISFYGATKLFQETTVKSVLRNGACATKIFRLQNVIGRHQSLNNPYTGLVCWFYNSLGKQEDLNIYENGEITRDFIDVRDVAKLLYDAITQPIYRNEIIDVGSGKQTRLGDIAKCLKDITGYKSLINNVDRFRLGDCKYAQSSNRLLLPQHLKQYSLNETLQDFVNHAS